MQGEEIHFAAQGILQLMEKTKETSWRVPVRLDELHEQVHSSWRRGRTLSNGAKNIQPAHVERAAGWEGDSL